MTTTQKILALLQSIELDVRTALYKVDNKQDASEELRAIIKQSERLRFDIADFND